VAQPDQAVVRGSPSGSLAATLNLTEQPVAEHVPAWLTEATGGRFGGTTGGSVIVKSAASDEGPGPNGLSARTDHTSARSAGRSARGRNDSPTIPAWSSTTTWLCAATTCRAYDVAPSTLLQEKRGRASWATPSGVPEPGLPSALPTVRARSGTSRRRAQAAEFSPWTC
jgi:hypothetical protein